ncbi:MAG: metalloregulator ArsR/SmtB family transcription factor [Bacteroides sp.]|nr:metalloregulator ArsR/SmtB family transcription factor [Prevotella sp.]MCM1408510.1 metalloregulator ArsR/SmtB family transcription factor [Treponema brennaborense]MCM1469329.1 metalloregulator ArsR/SmtB family transcription factor [Bacteroides sp.]
MNQEDAILEIFEKANECIPVFQAMSDSERLLILLKLFYAGAHGKNVTELSGKTRLSRPAVSHHLKVLKAAKIIESRKEGTQIYYTLNSAEKLSVVEDLLKKLQERLEAIGADFEKTNGDMVTRIISRAQASLK